MATLLVLDSQVRFPERRPWFCQTVLTLQYYLRCRPRVVTDRRASTEPARRRFHTSYRIVLLWRCRRHHNSSSERDFLRRPFARWRHRGLEQIWEPLEERVRGRVLTGPAVRPFRNQIVLAVDIECSYTGQQRYVKSRYSLIYLDVSITRIRSISTDLLSERSHSVRPARTCYGCVSAFEFQW